MAIPDNNSTTNQEMPIVSQPNVPNTANVVDESTRRLQNIHKVLIDNNTNAPENFEEFRSKLDDTKLSNIYNYLKSSPKGVNYNIPDSYEDFKKKSGYTDVVGTTSGTFPTVTIPTTELHKLDPTAKGVQEVQNWWEYVGKVGSLTAAPIVEAAEYLGKLPEQLSTISHDATSFTFRKMGELTGNKTYGLLADALDKELADVKDPKTLGDRFKRIAMGMSPIAMDELISPVKNELGITPESPKFRNLPQEKDPVTGEIHPTFVSKMVEAVAPLASEMMMLSTTPTTMMSSFGQRLGMKTMSNWPIYLSVKGSTQGETVGDRLENTVAGLGQGLVFEGLGMVTEKVSKNMARLLGQELKTTLTVGEKVLANPLSFTNQAAGMTTSAGVFAAYDATTQGVEMAITGQPFDVERLGVSSFMGLPFHAKPLVQGQGVELINAWRKREAYNRQAAWTATSDRLIKDIGSANIDPASLRDKIVSVQDKLNALPKEAGNVRTKLLSELNLYNNILRVNYESNSIVQNPQSYIDAVNRDQSLTPQTRTFLLNKINTTVENLDPNYKAARELEGTINNLTQELSGLEGNTTMPPNMLEAKKSAITEQLVNAKKDQKELFSKPSYFLNGERYNSASEFVQAAKQTQDIQGISNTIVRNDPKTASWVSGEQRRRIENASNDGVNMERMVQEEARITEMQKKFNLSPIPDIIIPDRVNNIADKIDKGKDVSVTEAQEASEALYAEYKRLENLKASKDLAVKRNTNEQIQEAQDFIGDEITNIESYVKARKSGESFTSRTSEIRSAREAQVQAAKDAQSKVEVSAAEGEAGTAGAGGEPVPKPEVKVEPIVEPVQETSPKVDAAVSEMFAFLSDRLYEGKTPSVDNAVRSIAEEFSEGVKSPEELVAKVKEVMESAFTGNDKAVKDVETLIANREEMIRNTFNGMQESGEVAFAAGEKVTKVSEVAKVREQEKSYREVLREQFSKEQQGKPSSAGLTSDHVDLAAKLAISYVREGVKTMDAVYRSVKAEFKDITGLTINREDFNRAAAVEVKGEERTAVEMMSIREEAISRTKGEKVSASFKAWAERNGYSTEGADPLLLAKFKAERDKIKAKTKVLVDEMTELERGYKNEIKGAKNVLQHVKDLKDWVSRNKDEINALGPDLSTAMMNKISGVKDEQSLTEAKMYLSTVLQKEKFQQRAKEISDNQKKINDKLKSGGFGNMYEQVADLVSLRYKPGTPKVERVKDPVTGDVYRILKVDESVIPNELANEYADVLKLLSGKGQLGVVDITRIQNLNDALRPEMDRQLEAKLAKKELEEMKVSEMTPEEKKDNVDRIKNLRSAYIDVTHKSLKDIDLIQTGHLMKEEAKLLGDIRKLSKEDLAGLTNTQMSRLRMIIDNAKNTGWVSSKLYSEVMLPVKRNRKVDVIRKSMDVGKNLMTIGEFKDLGKYKEIEKIVGEYESGVIDHTKLYDKLKIIPTNLLDTYFSNLQGGSKTPIYEAFHRAFNESISKMDTFIKDVEDNLFEIAKGVDKERGGSREGRVTATLLMDLYSLQRMYEADPLHNKEVGKYVDKVILSSVDRATKDLTQRLYDELPRTKDGKVDLNAVWNNTLTAAERRMVSYMDNVSSVMNDKLRYNTIYVHNQAYKSVPEYTRLNNVGNLEVDGAMELLGVDNFGRISTKSGSTNQRTQSYVIYMDKVRNFKQSLKENAVDVFLSPVMKETFGAFDSMIKQQGKVNPNARETLQAVRDIYYNNVKMELAGQFIDKSVSTRILEAILGASYNSVLANPGKMLSEYASNLNAAIVSDFNEFGSGNKGALVEGAMTRWKDGRELWDKVIIDMGSTHANRMYGSMTAEASDLYYNRMSESLGASRSERLADVVTQNGVKEAVKHMNMWFIRTPDAMVTRPYLIGQFTNNFKRIAGEKFDPNQYVNDPKYKEKYHQQIQDALAVADFKTTTLFNSTQKFDQALSTKAMPGDMLKRMNMFIVGFGRREYYSAMMGLKSAMYGDGILTRGEGAALVTALVMRNLTYLMALNTTRNMVSSGMSSLLGVPKEIEDESKNKSPESLALGVTASILTGRYNNFVKTPIAWALNGGMELYKTQVKEEEYSSKRDAIMYTGGNGYRDPRTYFSMMGPLSLLMNAVYSTGETAQQIGKETWDKDYWQGDTKGAIMAADVFIQSLNLAGLIPDYRDFKAALNTAKYNSSSLGETYGQPDVINAEAPTRTPRPKAPTRERAPSPRR
jgi:hypothetical protein